MDHDHSHMDHSGMDHGHMDHGDIGHGNMPMCNMNMLFTWDTTNLCIVFRQWHVRGPASLVFSLLAIVAICAGYEALREATRRYDSWVGAKQDSVGHNDVEQHDHHPEEQVTEQTPFLRATGRVNSGQDGTHTAAIGQRAHIVKAVLYAVQNFYAFMIMLLFMTYNGFVMIAVAVGAGLGYYFFGAHTKVTKETACH
ncbi:Uu.00g039440.m01.CDS01 [Anthostomella pinea]|uniref:Copper transport protein n=1 Tax=Anthostomella pinea TaxID=933095 RepID=A0AAI8YDR2_9PEZI|nr:Uu.00g039440.m01.CDS01 [Anthostomella pinea]